MNTIFTSASGLFLGFGLNLASALLSSAAVIPRTRAVGIAGPGARVECELFIRTKCEAEEFQQRTRQRASVHALKYHSDDESSESSLDGAR